MNWTVMQWFKSNMFSADFIIKTWKLYDESQFYFYVSWRNVPPASCRQTGGGLNLGGPRREGCDVSPDQIFMTTSVSATGW